MNRQFAIRPVIRRPPQAGTPALADAKHRFHFRLAPVGHHDALIDRKSTRLNSSHSQISYAVFCLKKKKNELSRRHPTASMPTDAMYSKWFTTWHGRCSYD